MTHNEKLVKFLELKHKVILEQSNLSCIDKQDMQSVLAWTEKDSEIVFKRIKKYIDLRIPRPWTLGLEVYTCPWCIYQKYISDSCCGTCQYGKNHNYCEGFLFSENCIIQINYVEILEEIENNT